MILVLCLLSNVTIEGLIFPYSGFSMGHNSVKNCR